MAVLIWCNITPHCSSPKKHFFFFKRPLLPSLCQLCRPLVGNSQYKQPFGGLTLLKVELPSTITAFFFCRSLEIRLSHFRWDICTNPRRGGSRGECTICSSLEELITFLKNFSVLLCCWCEDKDQASEVALCLQTSTKVVTKPYEAYEWPHTAYSLECWTFVSSHLYVQSVSHTIIKSAAMAAQSILREAEWKMHVTRCCRSRATS